MTTIKAAGIEQILSSDPSINGKWRVYTTVEGGIAREGLFDAADDASDDEMHAKAEAAIGLPIPREALTISRPRPSEPFDAWNPTA